MLCSTDQSLFPLHNTRTKYKIHKTHIHYSPGSSHLNSDIKTKTAKLRTYLTYKPSVFTDVRDMHLLRITISPSHWLERPRQAGWTRICMMKSPTFVYITDRVPQRMSHVIKTIKHFRISVKPIKLLKFCLWRYCISTLALPQSFHISFRKTKRKKQRQQSPGHSHLSLRHTE